MHVELICHSVELLLQKMDGLCFSVCSNVVVGAVTLWRSIISELQVLLAQYR